MGRKKYIDIAKALCMIGVVVGHLNVWLQAPEPYFDLVKFLHMYQMPFFFFVSGVHFKLAEKEPLKIFIQKRLKGLIKPYVIWVFILAVFNILFIYKVDLFSAEGLRRLIGPFLFEGNFIGSWFIACFFWAQLITALALLHFKKKTYAIVILAIGLIGRLLPEFMPGDVLYYIHKYHHLDVALTAAGLIGAGTLIRDNIDYGNNTIAAIAAAGISISYYFNSFVDMNHSMYGAVPLFILGAFSGIYLVMYISKKIEENLPYLRGTLEYIGRNSLWILFFHESIALILSYALDINNTTPVSGFFFVLYTVTAVGIPPLFIYIRDYIKSGRDKDESDLTVSGAN